MSHIRRSKRPAPDAYDHLWSLLPVYIAFFVTLVLIAAADDSQVQVASAAKPAPTVPAAQSQHRAADPSIPPAAAAMGRLPDVVSEPAATY